MLKKKHCTTPLIPPESRLPLKELFVEKPPFFRILHLLFGMAGPLAMAIRMKFSKRVTSTQLAIAIRDRLEEMGGLWIKAGQILGMRSDLFPREFCTVLAELQDRAFAAPPEQALPLIRESLGQPIEAVFQKFGPKPVAAASLAQVYRAELRNGVPVAVKLLRPYAREYFRHDFFWLKLYVLTLDWFGVMRHMRWQEMLTEIRRMMDDELEYRGEAADMKKMRKLLRAHKVYVPKVFFEYSSDRLLVMEFLEGTFMVDYASVKHSAPERLKAWEEENEIQPKKVARRLLNTLLRQAYEDFTFHGDLHPGNIVLLRRSRLALVDFGSVGQLDKEFAWQFDQYTRSQAEGNFSRAADIFLIMAGRLPVLDTEAVKKDLVRVLQDHARRTGLHGLKFHERSMTYSQAELSRVAGAHGLPVNWNLLRLARTFGAADVNFGILNPDFNYAKETVRYYQKAAERKRSGKLPEMLRAFDLVSNNLHFAIPRILERMFQFEGRITTGERVALLCFQLLWIGLSLGAVFLLRTYLYQQERGIWYASILLLIYLQVRFAIFIRNNKRPPARMPGDTN